MNKPELSYYKVPYWTCVDAGHRHKTEETAQRCITSYDNAINPHRKSLIVYGAGKERLARVTIKLIKGVSVSSIAKELELTNSGVYHIYKRAIRILSRNKNVVKHITNQTYVYKDINGDRSFYSLGIKEAREHKDFWIKMIEVYL